MHTSEFLTGAWQLDWSALESIATGAAAVIAVVLWQADKRRSRRGQARRVGGLLVYAAGLDPADAVAVDGGADPEGTYLVVRNGSEWPIFDVVARVPSQEVDPVRRAVLLPGSRIAISAPDEFLFPHETDSGDVVVEFTLDERRWRVAPGGVLKGLGRDRRKGRRS